MGYVERCLWEYRANAGALKLMREELSGLMSVRGQNYEAHAVNGVSDPVNEVVQRVMKLERSISRIERYTRPVEALSEYLSGGEMHTYHMMEILRLNYIEHGDHEAVMREIGISPATYWRRRRELLRLARKYFGE
ncbi:MAG: hypothetical protein IJL33_00260 [Ruminococcus sp.]|nr:hypothetical protein [Ruminococcus sp.]